MRMALTRPVPESLARCELTHLARVPIDVGRAIEQHQRYEDTLRALGCTVRRLPAAHDLPDSVFVEDIAIVLDEIAVMTRPGAESRRRERDTVAAVLSEYRPLYSIAAPGTLDGGDVMRLGRTLFVGLSTRTNEDGARQLAHHVRPLGYKVAYVQTRGCLHLKSAVTPLDSVRVVCNPDWVDPSHFAGRDVIHVDSAEPHAANVLKLGDALVCADAHPRTAAMLRARGYTVHAVDVSELAKAEAGVTCCSLIVE
jgi:dimethylargininase